MLARTHSSILGPSLRDLQKIVGNLDFFARRGKKQYPLCGCKEHTRLVHQQQPELSGTEDMPSNTTPSFQSDVYLASGIRQGLQT